MADMVHDDGARFVARPASRAATGVVVLHGFTGTPFSVQPLADAFSEAGYAVDLPLLPGHGTSVADLATRTYDEWLAGAQAAYARLNARCDAVFACGLSMGGTLALDLCTKADVAGVIVVNPYVVAPAPSFVDMLERALEQGIETIPSIGSDIAKPGVASRGYDATPIRPMLSLFDAVARLRPRLSSITVPTLLLSSRVDHVVPVESSDALAQALGERCTRVWLERSYHVATLDHDAPVVIDAALGFLQLHAGKAVRA